MERTPKRRARKGMCTLSNVETRGGECNPPGIRLTPYDFPDAKSIKTGVSVKYVHHPSRKWYVFRVSYGRVEAAYDYLIGEGAYTYLARRYTNVYLHGKRKRLLKPLIPNLIFVYVTKEEAEKYVYETPELPFLSYYYNHFEVDSQQKNPPLTISDKSMYRFVQATSNMNEHLMFVKSSQCHFRSGEKVVVTDGLFKGVEGRVARVAGQQRVIITLPKIGLISTAYIPSAFMEKIEDDNITGRNGVAT